MLSKEVDRKIREQFDLIEIVGYGAYGTVWRAKCRRRNQMVALKKVCFAFNNDIDAQRTYREILALNALRNHPKINKLLEVIPADNDMDLYLVLEFFPLDLSKVRRT